MTTSLGKLRSTSLGRGKPGSGLLALSPWVVSHSGSSSPVDPDRYMFFATRNRVPSGSLYTSVANLNYLCTKLKVGTPQYPTRSFRFHFSGFASTEGGNAPQETIVTGSIGTPGNSVFIDEFFIKVNGQPYPCTFNGGSRSVTIVDQTNGAWTDPVDIPGGVRQKL